MSRAATSPVLGCNTELEYKGRACHVQTEDSGVERPHVITHLFIGGGRIIVTRRTDYSTCLETDGYRDIVREVIRHQHREMLASLQCGTYDELLNADPPERVAPREEPPVDVGIVALAAARRREQRQIPTLASERDAPASARDRTEHRAGSSRDEATPGAERISVEVPLPIGQLDASSMEIDDVILADVASSAPLQTENSPGKRKGRG